MIQCPICSKPLAPLTTGGYMCTDYHFFPPVEYNFTTTTSAGTSIVPTPTFLSNNTAGPMKPERTVVPKEFYDAFEEDEQKPRSISFACANCEEPLTITARSPRSTISGTFCPKCDEQYYVCWEDGTLKKGRMVE